MTSVTIVGAGVAGLTIAYQLVRQGFHVTVIEKNAVVGGLARTFHYGDFHFDVGPHRFHTENSRVAEFIRRILGKEAIEIPARAARGCSAAFTSGRSGRASSSRCRFR